MKRDDEKDGGEKNSPADIVPCIDLSVLDRLLGVLKPIYLFFATDLQNAYISKFYTYVRFSQLI